ncbi:MAG: VCBS repeat-containing protein [Acidobacteriota bacterium]
MRSDAPFGGEQVIQVVAGVNNIAAGPLDPVDGADVFTGVGSSQTLSVALQDAGGTWTLQNLTPGSPMRSVEIGDLDGDGDNDLVYGDFNGDAVYWRENDLDTTGAFLPRATVASSIGRVQGLDIADIDGDGALDVVVAGRNADGYFWIENVNGDAGTWTRRTIATSVNAAQVVVAADIDGDGDLDVAGGSSSGSGRLAWFENVNGDGSSWLDRTLVSGRIQAVEAGDLDLDGDIDLLVQETVVDDILWFENTAGDGTAWTQRMISSFPAARNGLQARDLDFDGDLDVVGDPNGDWWENIDRATSWTRRSYSGATDVTDIAVVDVDVDGDLDIVAARSTAGQASWWANLTCSPGDADDDADGVRNGCDVCDGFDDRLDADGDLVPDGCDACPGFDDRVDLDNDGAQLTLEGYSESDSVYIACPNIGTPCAAGWE